MADPPTVYTPEEVGAMLHTSGRWIRDKIRAGEFPHLRVGNARVIITADQVQQIMTLCTRTPTPPTPKTERRIGTRARNPK